MPTSYQDTKSLYDLSFPDPRKRPKVIQLAEAYIACERCRPLEQQNPFTPIISDLLERVIASENELKQAERQRKSASSELKRLQKEAQRIIWNMWKSVTAKFSSKPEQAINWGFEYKVLTGNVLLPKTLNERLETLNSYIAQEQSRAEVERFTVPELIEVMNLCNTLQANADAREAGLKDRESRVELCNELVMELSNYLQVAGIYLLAMEFKFKLSKDLQKWGYDVSAKRSEAATRIERQEETAVPAPNGTDEVEIDVTTGEA
ncbi:MAG: hypothetical protein KDI79_32000 [Anaerolineae bacterium]|nr:hypothetical protein [Anaerolineae bacterium]